MGSLILVDSGQSDVVVCDTLDGAGVALRGLDAEAYVNNVSDCHTVIASLLRCLY